MNKLTRKSSGKCFKKSLNLLLCSLIRNWRIRRNSLHELSITQSMVELCEKNASGRKVLSVTMEIGELSGVVPDAVEFCFEACSRDTLLEGSRLIIERIPGRGSCACGTESPLSSYYDSCPACGGFGLTVTAGEELRVRELEVV